jgi:hypothetical protein
MDSSSYHVQIDANENVICYYGNYKGIRVQEDGTQQYIFASKQTCKLFVLVNYFYQLSSKISYVNYIRKKFILKNRIHLSKLTILVDNQHNGKPIFNIWRKTKLIYMIHYIGEEANEYNWKVFCKLKNNELK